MFYRPEDGHNLPHNPFNAIVSPRPIGWIASRSKDGIDNLAPYSFFNAVAYVPPQVMFSSAGRKDSLNNIEATGEFSVNLVGASMADAMNLSSQPLGPAVDEFTHAGLTKIECDTISCARVSNVPATLECKVTQIIRLEGPDNHAIFGEVTGVHMRDDCIVDGRFNVVTAQLLSRLGYRDYAQVTDLFELKRPQD